MEISDTEFDKANRRGAAKRATFPTVVDVRYDARVARIVISFESGLQLSFPPRAVEGLERAKPDDFAGAEITPSGLGIHFPQLDADVYIPGLLEDFLGFRRWNASQMGKAGGQVSSDAKAEAARANGQLGGRPRKVKQSLP